MRGVMAENSGGTASIASPDRHRYPSGNHTPTTPASYVRGRGASPYPAPVTLLRERAGA